MPEHARGSGRNALRGSWVSSIQEASEAAADDSDTATGETDASGGSLAFWGRAAQSSFDGREGAFSLDGETTTAMLDADYARGKWLVGLALMQSSGEGGYADAGTGSVRCPQDLEAETRAVLCDGAVRQGDGKVQPLDVFVRSREEWRGWQAFRPRNNQFNRPYIFR